MSTFQGSRWRAMPADEWLELVARKSATMNRMKLSQRLSARTHFKSLLLLSLLTGSASAQQGVMPTIAFEVPVAVPGTHLSPPSLDVSMPSNVEAPVMPSVSETWLPAHELPEVDRAASRSTWTLRQHATWLLGLKPRQVPIDFVEPSLPGVPQVDIVAAAVVPVDTHAGSIMLVQHNEPAEAPSLVNDAAVSLAVHAQDNSNPTPSVSPAAPALPPAPALPTVPHSLNLGPVVAGPVPALPLESLEGDSLLQVDVSGIDAARVASTPPVSESLIDGITIPPPIGFSLNDNEKAVVAASPSRAKPVSIHEGFSPRKTTANQSAQLSNKVNREDASDRPGTPSTVSKFSLSDTSERAPTGPIVNRLSDKDTVHEKLGDQPELDAPKLAESKAIEKSLSDKGPVLDSKPVEILGDGIKTSRGGKPVVLTPPDRLANTAPTLLPLPGSTPIASTGVDSHAPSKLDALPAPQTKKQPEPTTKPDQLASKTAPSLPQPEETLMNVAVPAPTLLVAAAPKLDSHEVTTEKKPTASPANVSTLKPQPASVVSKAQLPRTANRPDRPATVDANPIAMKKPLIKAATVIPSSHEHVLEQATDPETAEYAKMAVKMQEAVRQKFPGLRVKISCNEDGLIVEGNVTTNVEASKVLSFVRKTSLCPVADRVTTKQ